MLINKPFQTEYKWLMADCLMADFFGSIRLFVYLMLL